MGTTERKPPTRTLRVCHGLGLGYAAAVFLSGLMHRQRLFEVTTRWFAGQLDSDDGRFLSELFVYERLLLEPPLRRLLRDLTPQAAEGAVSLQGLDGKDGLRALLAADPRARQDEAGRLLCQRLVDAPEEFFPLTPADLVVALRPTSDGLQLASLLRVKRLRRLSQKASRLLAGHLAAQIRKTARGLARQRAEAAGVPLDGFFTPPETMAAEFAHAERAVAHAIRDGQIRFAPADLTIDDVLGLRLLADDEAGLDALEVAVKSYPQLEVLQARPGKSIADGDRVLLVSLQLPAVDELLAPLGQLDWSFARHRGLSVEELAAGLRPYAQGGAREVHVEVRLTLFSAWLEQELGPNPPEERLFEERHAPGYRGRIAENTGYLIEHLLMHAVSPRAEVEQLPFQLSGRYLPDALALIVGRLFAERPPAAESFLKAP